MQNAADKVIESISSAFPSRDLRPIYEWAEEKVSLFPPYAKTGQFDVSGSRQFIKPMDSLNSERTPETNVCAPVRSGKSLFGDLWLPKTLDTAPGAFLGIFQSDQIAEQHVEARTFRLLKSIPSIRRKLPTDRHKDRKAEIIFPDAPVYFIGQEVRKLQSKGFRYVWFDEPWLYKEGTIGEGKGRLGDYVKFMLHKILCTSQGGYAVRLGADKTREWFDQYHSGEINEWHIRCASCGREQMPTFNGKRSDKSRWGLLWTEARDERGNWIIGKCLPTIRYECFFCGHPHIDGSKTKSEWNRTGDYKLTTEPNDRRKSFHWNGLIDYPWAELVEMYLHARNAAHQGDKSKTIQFHMKQLAEFHDPEKAMGDFEQLSTIEITSESTDKPIEVDGISFIHRAGLVDVQHDHFWFLHDAWSAAGDDITIHFEKLYSWDEVEDRRARFGIPHENMAVDVSHRRHEVITECTRHGHFKTVGNRTIWACWKAFQGSDRASFIWMPKTGKLKGQRVELPYSWPPQVGDPCFGLRSDDSRRQEFKGKTCQIYQWSNPTIKDIAQRRRDGQASGTKTLVADGAWNDEFSRQMFSEKKVNISNTLGQQQTKWQRFRDNHGWDCKCMSVTIAFLKHILGTGHSREETQ
jgi:hypothetical protein